MRASGHRKVRGLKWARELGERPAYIPVGRPRGVKALGTRYEKAFERELGPGWLRGRWFEYEDERGLGCCQVDFLGTYGRLWLLETKFTWTLEGHSQLEDLYLPVVGLARGIRPEAIGLVLVCKNLTRGTRSQVGRIVGDLDNALASYTARSRMVLQWLPGTPVRAPRMHGGTLDHAIAS